MSFISLFDDNPSGSPQMTSGFSPEEQREHERARECSTEQNAEEGDLINLQPLRSPTGRVPLSPRSIARNARKIRANKRNLVPQSSSEFDSNSDTSEDEQAPLVQLGSDSRVDRTEEDEQDALDKEYLSIRRQDGTIDDSQYQAARVSIGSDSFLEKSTGTIVKELDISELVAKTVANGPQSRTSVYPNASVSSVFGTNPELASANVALPVSPERKAERLKRRAKRRNISPHRDMDRQSTIPGGRANSTSIPNTSVLNESGASKNEEETLSKSSVSYDGHETFFTEVSNDTVIYQLTLKLTEMKSHLESTMDKVADYQSNEPVGTNRLIQIIGGLKELQLEGRRFYETLRNNKSCSKKTVDLLKKSIVEVEVLYYPIVEDLNQLLVGKGGTRIEPLIPYLTLGSKDRKEMRQSLFREKNDSEMNRRMHNLLSPAKSPPLPGLSTLSSSENVTSNHPPSVGPQSFHTLEADDSGVALDQTELFGADVLHSRANLEIGRKESGQKLLDELSQKQVEGILKDPLHKRKSGNNVRLSVPNSGAHNSTNSSSDKTDNLSQTNESQSRGATKSSSNSDSSESTEEEEVEEPDSNGKKWDRCFDREERKESTSTPRGKRSNRRGKSTPHVDLTQAFQQLLEMQLTTAQSHDLETKRYNQKFQDTLELISKGSSKGSHESETFIDTVSESFYSQLPKPWNVTPRKKGKLSDERQAMGVAKDNTFHGDSKDYLPWRNVFLENVHRARVPVSQKLTALIQRLSDSVPYLKSLSETITFSPHDYAHIIKQLESKYGGDVRIMQNLTANLMNGPPLQRKSISSVRSLLQRFESFRNFAANQGMESWYQNEMTVMMIKKSLFKSDDLDYFQTACRQNRWKADFNGIIRWLEELVLTMSDREQVKEFQMGNHQETYVKPKTFLTSESRARSSSGASALPSSQPESCENAQFSSLEKESAEVEEDCLTDYSLRDSDTESETEISRVLFGSGKAPQFTFPECAMCPGKNHLMKDCEPFAKLDPRRKFRIIADAKMCFKCLSKKHVSSECPRQITCRTCEKAHNTLLHDCFDKSK